MIAKERYAKARMKRAERIKQALITLNKLIDEAEDSGMEVNMFSSNYGRLNRLSIRHANQSILFDPDVMKQGDSYGYTNKYLNRRINKNESIKCQECS